MREPREAGEAVYFAVRAVLALLRYGSVPGFAARNRSVRPARIWNSEPQAGPRQFRISMQRNRPALHHQLMATIDQKNLAL